MSSKNEKAAQARAQAQAQVKAQERRTTLLIVGGSVVGLALFAALVLFIVNQGKVPELGEDGAVAPAAADATGGIPVGAGGVVGEDVPAGEPRVDVYFDFMCPICHTFEQTNADDLDAMREGSEIQLYYHPVSILDRYSNGTNYSTRAAGAAGVVADQAPEAFVDFVDALFVNAPEEGTDGLDDAAIKQIAIDAGVPEDVAGNLTDAGFRKWATAATEQASKDGMQGTPTVRVSQNGEFADGAILDPNVVNYFQPGALREHIESLG